MTRCIVTTSASRHIRDIRAFISRDDEVAAERVVGRIYAVIDLLTAHPEIGRRTRIRGLRMFSVGPTPYLIYYRYALRRDEVLIVRVVHSAQRRPSLAEDGAEFRHAAMS